MRKSIWIELVEWCVLAAVALFTVGVLLQRGEITSPVEASSSAPVQSLDE
jgi:hypothetical protein